MVTDIQRTIEEAVTCGAGYSDMEFGGCSQRWDRTDKRSEYGLQKKLFNMEDSDERMPNRLYWGELFILLQRTYVRNEEAKQTSTLAEFQELVQKIMSHRKQPV